MFTAKDGDFFELEEDDFDTVLADDIEFIGTVQFAKPFMIKGTVRGTIDATSDLVIDSNALVSANITANRVLVKGRVEGDITAQNLVFVTKKGIVHGDITAAQVVLEPGSVFTGRCIMTQRHF
ncbi:MAG: polymer-forming cytoskeletal protein [Treponema sp.]|nr:polymer-forming cytoskeletal protein [Treponema sp.]